MRTGTDGPIDRAFTIQMLPAGAGDCLWIEYGDDPTDPYRILIDGGQESSSDALLAKVRGLATARFELIVVTHVHDDHIGGVIRLLKSTPGISIGEVWFNDRVDHPDVSTESYPQGNELAALIAGRHPWNVAFGGMAIAVDPTTPPPCIDLPGGMRVAVLAPTLGDVRRLRSEWDRETAGSSLAETEMPPQLDPLEIEAACPPKVSASGQLALADQASVADDSVANRSSIVLVLEYARRRVLLTGDSHADVIRDGLVRLNGSGRSGPPKVHVVKLPHHGSRRNNDWALFNAVDSSTFLISTDGTMRHCHPNPEAIARLSLAHPDSRVIFNEVSEANGIWTEEVASAWRFRPEWPEGGIVDVLRV